MEFTNDAKHDKKLALWQLAHECVHLLAPSHNGTTILEEGMAGYHQRHWIEKCPAEFPEWARSESHGISDDYNEAADLVEKLLSTDKYAIRQMRHIEPIISEISEDLILHVVPNFGKTGARKLAKKFRRK